MGRSHTVSRKGSSIPPSKEAPGGGVAEDLASNTMTTCPDASPAGWGPKGVGVVRFTSAPDAVASQGLIQNTLGG